MKVKKSKQRIKSINDPIFIQSKTVTMDQALNY